MLKNGYSNFGVVKLIIQFLFTFLIFYEIGAAEEVWPMNQCKVIPSMVVSEGPKVPIDKEGKNNCPWQLFNYILKLAHDPKTSKLRVEKKEPQKKKLRGGSSEEGKKKKLRGGSSEEGKKKKLRRGSSDEGSTEQSEFNKELDESINKQIVAMKEATITMSYGSNEQDDDDDDDDDEGFQPVLAAPPSMTFTSTAPPSIESNEVESHASPEDTG